MSKTGNQFVNIGAFTNEMLDVLMCKGCKVSNYKITSKTVAGLVLNNHFCCKTCDVAKKFVNSKEINVL